MEFRIDCSWLVIDPDAPAAGKPVIQAVVDDQFVFLVVVLGVVRFTEDYLFQKKTQP